MWALWTLLACTGGGIDETGGDNLGGQAGEDTATDCPTSVHESYEAEAVTPLGTTVADAAAVGTLDVAVAWASGGTTTLYVDVAYAGEAGVWTNAGTCEERLEIEVDVTAATADGALSFPGEGRLRVTEAGRVLYAGAAPNAVSGSWEAPDTAVRVELHLDLEAGTGSLRVVHADGSEDAIAELGP